MRIAALVHNGVLNDARVIKEAMTLRAAGYEVDIHGIAPHEQAEHHILPGTDIEVFLEPRAAPRPAPPPPSKIDPRVLRYGVMWPLQFFSLLIGGALLWWCALQLEARYAAVVGHQTVFAAVLLLGAVGGVGFMFFRRLQWRVVSSIMTRRYRAARAKQAQALAASRSEADAGDNFYRLTDAMLASVSRRPIPDVIHLHDHVSLVLADRLKALYKRPIVWDAHEIYQELADSDPRRAQANADIIAAKHPFIDYFITINDSIARFYQEHYPRMPDPQVVMNASMIAPVPVYDGRLHDAAQLPREQKIILFQGGFSPHRGLPQLVEAANALPAEWTLVMMGWGGMEAELRAMVNHHSRQAVSPTVVFLPGVPQHELQQWSAGATLGVIPYENTSLNHLYCTPNKLWEYPSAGVPVLCSDLIEMTAVLEKYEFGFLLPREFSSADIVSVVSGLSAERLATARVNCASWLDANNWSVWERNLLAIYDNIRIARQAGDGRAALVS